MSKNKENEDEEKKWFQKWENYWIIAGGIIALVAIAVPFSIVHFTNTNYKVIELDKLGTIGDFFGGTTVGLFTLASITLVTAAIVMQKEELTLQRKELKATRLEFEIGNSTAKVQQIDNAFFNMLSLNHQITNDIKITRLSNTYTGRTALIELRQELIENLAYKKFLLDYPDKSLKYWYDQRQFRSEYIQSFLENDNGIDQVYLDEVYKEFHDDYGYLIGHYMRNNYRIVKFIVENVVENDSELKELSSNSQRKPILGDRRYYFGMLRAQWSTPEFELIFINSLYSQNKKFKKLIIDYDVLDIKESEENHEKENNFKIKKDLKQFNVFRKLIELEK